MISSIPRWMSQLFESSIRPNVSVLQTAYLTPAIKEISFQGNISTWNPKIGYASVVRVSETEFRNYTIAHHNKEDNTFSMIFHIHGNGIGSKFIDNLTAGDELFISPPRGKSMYVPTFTQQLFFGDETSLAIARAFLPVLKKNNHQFQFYLELNKENRNVPELLGLENCTVFIKDGSFSNEKWISELPLFKTGEWDTANFILTGNVKSVQAFRKVLKNISGVSINSQGYWLEGKKGL